MTDAVIIVLREVLEATLLICMLMASSTAMGQRFRWMLVALLLGVGGATLYALRLEQISMSFDGFGQEIVNSSLLIGIALVLTAHNFLAVFQLRNLSTPLHYLPLALLSIAAVGMAITREGAEIYLYVYSYGVLAGNITPVFSGGAIGLGIGLSVGTFFYYGLKSLPRQQRLLSCVFIALVLAAGMMGESATYLAQADIIPAQEALWDSSGLLAENSLFGELLHAAIGYEARPTAAQLVLYLSALLLSLVAMLAAWRLRASPAAMKRERQ